MRVDQAIFGEQRGGHSLREASGDRPFAAELASRLDLPDTAPSGVVWSPFASGFPHADRYVLARTVLDPEAPRSGMVLSHALIVPLQDILTSTDLRPLFARLITEPKQPRPLVTFDLDLHGDAPAPTPELVGAAEALTTRGTGPVVRLGLNGYDDLIVSLWARLSPAARRTFAFRLSFSPSDLVENPVPTLICTPETLVTRWRGYRIIDPTKCEPATLAAALLAGQEQSEPLIAFADLIESEVNSLTELPLLEQAYRLAKLDPDTFANTTAALRLVNRLSPNPTRGIAAKAQLLERLEFQIETADANAILTLRNLDLDGFAARNGLWKSLQHWAETSTFPVAQDSAFLTVINDAVTGSSAIGPWREAVSRGLRAAVRRNNGGFAPAFWRWAELEPALLSPLAGSIDLTHKMEAAIASAAPSTFGEKAALALLCVATERQLPELHGVAVSTIYCALEAARTQIRMEGTNRSARGLLSALRNATPEELIASALEIADAQLLDLAAAAVTRRPDLLTMVDMGGEPGQAIWTAALAKNPGAWRGPWDPVAAAGRALINMLDGGLVYHDLVDALARTPLADLGGFARRAELWEKLNVEAQQRFLQATADGWVEKARVGDVPFAPDHRLETTILNSARLNATLNGLAERGLAGGLRLVAALPSFPEQRFLLWLPSVLAHTHALPTGEAEALGRLLLERQWRYVVNELVDYPMRNREDLRPALRVCISMLGYLTIWWLGLSSLTSAEKWQSFEELAAQLYPTGPDHNELWERAGGSNADLPLADNGRSRWRETLSRMRLGGGHLRADELLAEMRKDYPMNEQLRFLSNENEFARRR